jgi:hypothetical protein
LNTYTQSFVWHEWFLKNSNKKGGAINLMDPPFIESYEWRLKNAALPVLLHHD